MNPVRIAPEADLERLAVIARLRGLNAASPDSCFCVELGCRDGLHLIALAARYPESRFLGIESSARHLAAAERLAEATGVRNVAFSADASFDHCDYLVSVERFSFVSPEAQRRMLDACVAALAPAGAALIGFDCSPGAHWIRMMRRTLLDHVGAREGEEAMHRAAAELVGMQAEGLNVNQPLLAAVRAFREELSRMRPADFAAQFLSDEYTPLSLHAFVEGARRAGLDYVDDTGFESRQESDLNPGVWEKLGRFAAGDRVRMEQYLDFATGRAKRHALVCRAGAATGAPIDGLHAIRAGTAPDSDAAAFLARLASVSPASIPVADSGVPAETIERLYRANRIHLRTSPSPSVRLSVRPRAWPLTRYLAGHGYAEGVTPLHAALPLTDLRRGLLLLADGARSRVEIEAAIRGFGAGGDAAAWHRAIGQEFAVLEAAGVFVA